MEQLIMRLIHIFIIATLICAFSATASLAGSDDLEDLSSLSLDELLDLEFSVASISAKTTREQSAIVSVITARDISASGARDLLDVLWLVPGFSSGVDVEGITGIGIRGFWAYDGKVLVTVDGMSIIENLYGVVPLGEHIPVAMIERVEIIRGPGSAMYGDNAELAVINIVTKGPKLNGGFASSNVGTDGDDVSGQAGAIVGAGNDDLHVDIAGYWTSSYRSTSKYTDNDGVVVDLEDNSDIKTLFLNTGVNYKDLEVRVLYDVYNVDDVVQYGWAIPRYRDGFESVGVSAKYDFELSDALTITPKVVYNYQEPWRMAPMPDEEYKISTQRVTANVTAVGKLGALGPIDSTDLLGGFEFFSDFAHADQIGSAGGESTYYNGRQTVDYQNYAGFLQADLDSRWVDLSVGGRYHYHSEAGGKFVPRVAITRAWEKFHAKGLFSQAFRTPQIELIQTGGPGIKPEMATSYELEAGYRFTDNLSAVVNAFWIEVEDILVYSSIDGDYQNFDSVTNYGVEAEVRFADTWGNVAMGYSYYRNHRNDNPSFCTQGPVFYLPDYSANPAYADCGESDGLLLGMPAHKLTFNGTYMLTDHLSVNLNGAFISKRITYAVGMLERRKLDSQVYANLFLQYQRDDFSVGIGVRDLFDKEYAYAQPFDSGVRELPGKGREFFLKASWAFNGNPFAE
jgi:outer membrane receptor for ferrienterochelin and colicins